MAIWQMLLVEEKREVTPIMTQGGQSYRGEAGSVWVPESWNLPKSHRCHQHTADWLSLPALSSTSVPTSYNVWPHKTNQAFTACLLISYYGQAEPRPTLVHTQQSCFAGWD